jgi:hypothetical protein
MQNSQRWIGIILLLIAGLQLAACGGSTAVAESEKPAHLEEIEGSEFKRVVLTERAAERTGIETAPVVTGAEVASIDPEAAFVPPADQIVVPYAAVIYGLHGETWVYTSPEPLTYVRETIEIDRIEGELAILTKGPEPGTEVVTVGVIELYGEETGIKK